MPADEIQYSDRYYDKEYEYRHVLLPPDLARVVPRTHLLSETEWRNLGVQQSTGWIHYMFHTPEPHVLLFRRARTKEEVNNNGNGTTGATDATTSNQSQSQVSEASAAAENSQASQATSTTSTGAVVCA